MRVAVIGGGAAGLMCAATISEENPSVDVFLIEKNSALGKKVLISGGGRCNVTTGIQDVASVLEKYPRGGKFLRSAMHRFSPEAVCSWFYQHGVPLKCEDDLRIFPQSGRGADVVNVFEAIFKKYRMNVFLNRTVKSIEKRGDTFRLSFKDQEDLEADKVVMALGGQAYRQTGSAGDGYALAESLGHHITKLAPSLYSFLIKENRPKSLAGLSFGQVIITAECPKPNTSNGALLFTHGGVSGPAVFALSSQVAFVDFNSGKPLSITIDVLPDFTIDASVAAVKKLAEENPKKSFKNTLRSIIPLSLAEVVCQELGISFEKRNAEVSNKELCKTIQWIKGIPLQVVGRGKGDEFVTAGGVELGEVNPQTMESKFCQGLYFAGEILDVDGFTGGFNLQAAWATGRLAGINIAYN